MLDFNDAVPAQPFERFDIDAIVEALRRDASVWVPQHFPNGRREGDAWRLANIYGAPPRKQGSCVIALTGANAGDWIDFDGSGSGGPFSALEQVTGLHGRDLYAYAAALVGERPQATATAYKKRSNVAAEPSAARQPRRRDRRPRTETGPLDRGSREALPVASPRGSHPRISPALPRPGGGFRAAAPRRRHGRPHPRR